MMNLLTTLQVAEFHSLGLDLLSQCQNISTASIEGAGCAVCHALLAAAAMPTILSVSCTPS